METKPDLTAEECRANLGNISIPIGIVCVVKKTLEDLGLSKFLSTLKKRGMDLNVLTTVLIIYILNGGDSLQGCADWLANDDVRKELGLEKKINQRTLNRALQRLGNYREKIITQLYKGLLLLYPDIDKDIDVDGSAVATNSEGGLSGRGYGRDKNPDGLQVEFMLGMFEVARIPFYINAFKGNMSDEEQYARAMPEMLGLLDQQDIKAYENISNRLIAGINQRREEKQLAKLAKKHAKRGRKPKQKPQQFTEAKENLLEMNRRLGNVSWVIMDNGGASVYNTDAINEMGHEYLTRKDMNLTDMELTKRSDPVQVEPGLICWSETFESSGRTKYIYYADYLFDAKRGAAERKVAEMNEFVNGLRDGTIDPRSLVTPKDIPGVEFDYKVTVQSIVTEFTEEENEARVKKLMGRYCGFFHLESSAPLTPLEAIQKYRKRVAIEHAIRSLKNVSGIKPLRVWDEKSVTGRMILALLAEVVISMIRYEYPADKVKVTRKGVTSIKDHKPEQKTLVKILGQLTATYFNDGKGQKSRVISAVDPRMVGIMERLEARNRRNPTIESFV